MKDCCIKASLTSLSFEFFVKWVMEDEEGRCQCLWKVNEQE